MKKKLFKNQLEKDYFSSMYSMEAIQIVKEYFKDEEKNIEKSLKYFPDKYKTIICIACGPAIYSHFAMKKKIHYLGVEPLIEIFKSQITFLFKNKSLHFSFIDKKIENLTRKDLQKCRGPRIFIFPFNIVNYIPIIEVINKIASKKDLIILGTWSKTKKSTRLREEYFSYLNHLSPYKKPFDCEIKFDYDSFDFGKVNALNNPRLFSRKINTCLAFKMK